MKDLEMNVSSEQNTVTKAHQQKDDKAKPLTDALPTGRPTDDRFEAETAHFDVSDQDLGGEEKGSS
jgi:hypothetical protein